jgi:hypothetical protein
MRVILGALEIQIILQPLAQPQSVFNTLWLMARDFFRPFDKFLQGCWQTSTNMKLISFFA